MASAQSRAKSVFGHALAIEAAGERAAYLEQACGEDAALRAEVEGLLAALEGAGDAPQLAAALERARHFLRLPAGAWEAVAGPGPDVDEGGPTAADAPAEAAGSQIGPYKLLQRLGEGGMGTVWAAEQSEPVKRRVALKLVKPGLDSAPVLRRFEAERQALALMDHPNIAKVLDAGTTAAGRPYFVMELVKGVPLTRYCDELHLPIKERLALFTQVCAAIQHAHQKGVVHRDIKPGNVLVCLQDGKPVPKVIDFGVAKALHRKLAEQSLYTEVGQVVGTLEYMAPEQAELSALDVDTRADVYALGVLLYELLTGSTPLEKGRLRQAALLEVLRLIREEEPPRPSARLSGSHDALPGLAAQRRTEPGRLARAVRGELDWIVMRCLEKDRTRRYDSAGALARDVERHLADEPVEAGPPSSAYRLKKFAWRHRTGLGVATCLLGALVLGGGAMWRDLGQRAAAAASVEAALERAELLRQQEHWQEAGAVLDVARGQLEGRGPAALRQRVEQARRDVEMLMRLEEARLQRSVDDQKTGWDYAGADRLYAQAFREYGLDVTALDPEEAARRVRSSAIREPLTEALDNWASCRDKISPAAGREALRAVARLADDPWRQRLRDLAGHADRAALEALAEREDTRSKPPAALLRLAVALREAGNRALAERLLRQAQADHAADFWLNCELAYILADKKAPDPGQAVRFFQAALALRPQSPAVLSSLGSTLVDQGKLAEGEAAIRKAIELQPNLAKAHNNLGNGLAKQGKLAEAETAFRRSIELEPDSAIAHCNLGIVLRRQRKLAEAEAADRKAIELKPDLVEAHCNLGSVLWQQRRFAEAEAAFRKAIELQPDYALAYHNLGTVLRDQGKSPELAWRKAVELKPDYAEAHNALGVTLGKKGKLAEAEAAFRSAVKLRPDYAEAQKNFGLTLYKQGKLAEAEAAYRRAIELRPEYATGYSDLGTVLRIQGRLAEAEAACRKAIALKPDLADGHGSLASVLELRGEHKAAIACNQEAIRLEPDSAPAHNNLAWLLATCPDPRLRDPGQAVNHAEKAVQLAPDVHDCWSTLGVAQYRNGAWQPAIAALMKSAELCQGGDSNHCFFLAMAHWQLNEKEKARAWYDRAVAWMDQHKPQDEELKRFRAEAAALLGLTEAAEAQSKQP